MCNRLGEYLYDGVVLGEKSSPSSGYGLISGCFPRPQAAMADPCALKLLVGDPCSASPEYQVQPRTDYRLSTTFCLWLNSPPFPSFSSPHPTSSIHVVISSTLLGTIIRCVSHFILTF
jgi:hypothetical protein